MSQTSELRLAAEVLEGVRLEPQNVIANPQADSGSFIRRRGSGTLRGGGQVVVFDGTLQVFRR